MVATGLTPNRYSRPDAGQEVRFCRGFGGVRLAYALHGSGPPLVVVSCWLSHLQYDWQSPVWRHFLDDLGAISTLVRYDERGFGMSDWNVTDFSIDARLGDLEAIVAALGFDRFALLGMSGAAPVAMAYAARHPERVTRMILYGAPCGGLRTFEPDELAEEHTFRSMIRVGWAKPDPLFRRVFTGFFIPNATEEQMSWIDDLQRMSTSPENMVASRIARQETDIFAELPRITAPTLVLQALRDRAVGFDNAPRIASAIPDARLVPLDSPNHILLATEPAWATFMAEVRAFIEPDRQADPRAGAGPREELSPRELDVLRSAADGHSNDQIADVLGLSVRTVERHLSNAYAKLGVGGKSARAGAVAEVLRRGLA
jgi:pimeloyl-ACP methyl ester carboxylesterase/DNA-binding CsgD family transcriptional regulator